MTFDEEKYYKALENFLIRMQEIPKDDVYKVTEVLSDICTLLNVARIETDFFSSPHQELRGIGLNEVVYADGEYNEKEEEVCRETTVEDSIIVAHLYARSGYEWSDMERKKLTVLGKMLLVFSRRHREMIMAEEYSYQETTLGIHNFKYYNKITEELIKAKEISQYMICYFNLKRFSIINQQLGRETGTNIMRIYVMELQRKLGADGAVCRVNGDNFVALFKKEKQVVVMSYLKRRKVYYDQGSEAYATVESTVGYYDVSEEDVSSNDLMDRVTVAFQMAAHSNHVSYTFFDDDMMEETVKNKKIETLFHEALMQREFHVYYQPKVNIKNYSLKGAEALCRWIHDGEVLPPFEFIPVLEQSHAICELDFYMLDAVCRDIRRWIDEGKKVVRVSVNFSRQHMGEEGLSRRILEVINRYGIPHKYIEIELTETTTDVSFKELAQIVEELQKEDVRTAVDDFGVGYSSLNLIREIPWDVLKVDKSFLPEILDVNSQKYIMFRYLVALAQDLGLDCIIEGVETVEHIRMLKENHCYLAQGYYFDRPLPKDEFEARLKTERKAN